MLGIFGKKKKGAEDAQTEVAENITPVAETKSAKKQKKRKPKEMVSSVIEESVLEQILEEFRANTQFVSHTPDGEVAYVGLLLRTEQIGGLSAKTNKDEAKGSIVERIKNGSIKIFATKELLDNESFVIIPDAMTVDAMSEYSLLTGLTYALVFVTDNGDVTEVGAEAQVSDISLILNDATQHIDDSIYEEVVEEPVEEDVIEDEPIEESDEEIPAFDDTLSDEVPLDEEIPMDEESVSEDDVNESADEDVVEDEPSVFTGSDFEAAIKRKFYSDDLGLEVSTEPFDQQFLHNNFFVPFSENRSEGWLNNYLNNMSKEANQEMMHMREQNIMKLRNDYFTMVSLSAQKIAADCDYTSTATLFGEQAAFYETQKQEKEADIDDIVAREKDNLEKAWNAKLDEIANAAAMTARKEYKERFGRQHEDEIYHIQFNIHDEISSQYNENMRKLHEDRRLTAFKKLDTFVHEALQRAAEDYATMLSEENIRYKQLQANMQQFMDENRKDEIARTQALAEELAQTQKVDAVMAEQTEKLKNMVAEFEAKKLVLQQDLKMSEDKRHTDLAEMKLRHEESIADLKTRNETLQNQIDDLMREYSALDSRKEREYSHRVNELRDELASWSDKCDHITNVHRKSNIIGGFLAAAAVIAALSIGFIIGAFINMNGVKHETQSQIISEFNQQMDNVAPKATESAK